MDSVRVLGVQHRDSGFEEMVQFAHAVNKKERDFWKMQPDKGHK